MGRNGIIMRTYRLEKSSEKVREAIVHQMIRNEEFREAYRCNGRMGDSGAK